MNDYIIRVILDWVEQNIYTEATIEDLASVTGYSRRGLEIIFRKHCGLTPGEYLNRRKLSRAAILLKLTLLNVNSIASMFHFYSPQNFARAFKKFSGVTPTAWRNEKKWETGGLQCPLSVEGIWNLTPEVCERPAVMFRGRRIMCPHNFLAVSSGENMMKVVMDYVEQNVKSSIDECDIAFCITPSALFLAGHAERMYVEMILEDKEGDINSEMITIPPGKYVRFNFSGSWSEYITFTRLIYWQLFAHKIIRRDCADITHFSFPKDSNELVSCQHFVPVE